MSRPVDPASQPRGIFGASSREQLMMRAVATIKLPRLQSENSPAVCESISNGMTAKWSRFAIFFWRPERAFIQPIEPNIVNGRCGQSSAFVDRRSIGRSAPVRGHFSTATKLLRVVRIEDLLVRRFRTCLRRANGEILLRNGYHAAEGVLSTG